MITNVGRRQDHSTADAATGILLFGFSHSDAPGAALDHRGIAESAQAVIIERVLQSPLVTEAMVLCTANRVEVYAVAQAFPGAVSVISQVLSEHAGMSVDDLTRCADIRHGECAAENLFLVVSKQDSTVTGERHVLGQLRRAYSTAEANRGVGPVLHTLAERALTVGKRARSESAFGTSDASALSVALQSVALQSVASQSVESPMATSAPGLGPGLKGKTAVMVVDGMIGASAVTHLTRAGFAQVYVVTRSASRGQRIVRAIRESGARADALGFERLPDALAAADVVISCTATARSAISAAELRQTMAARRAGNSSQPLVICDLGGRHNLDRELATIPGVWVVGMDRPSGPVHESVSTVAA